MLQLWKYLNKKECLLLNQTKNFDGCPKQKSKHLHLSKWDHLFSLVILQEWMPWICRVVNARVNGFRRRARTIQEGQTRAAIRHLEAVLVNPRPEVKTKWYHQHRGTLRRWASSLREPPKCIGNLGDMYTWRVSSCFARAAYIRVYIALLPGYPRNISRRFADCCHGNSSSMNSVAFLIDEIMSWSACREHNKSAACLYSGKRLRRTGAIVWRIRSNFASFQSWSNEIR
jgi:hypothetical protein